MAIEAGTESCAGCGASVYREHLDAGIAARIAGKLYCNYCLPEHGGAPMPVEGPGEAEGPAVPVTTGPRRLKRAPATNVQFATRCKTFHCKLAPGPIEHMDEIINEWADSSPDIQIKFATTTVGVVEGKHPDPHLLITVFY